MYMEKRGIWCGSPARQETGPLGTARFWCLLGLTLICAGCRPTAPPLPAAAAAQAEVETLAQDWCSEHGVPESKCSLCHPDLIAGFQAAGDWCAEHGLPESVCPKCGAAPAAAVASEIPAETDWCSEHGVPEFKCTICHADLIAAFQAAGDWCAEHKLPESVCPSCALSGGDAHVGEQRVVRLKNPDHEVRVGIRVESVRRGAPQAEVTGPARLAFSADRSADLRAVLPGVVREVYAAEGAYVEQGQALFKLVSPMVGEVQGRLRTARAHLKMAELSQQRTSALAEQGIVSRVELEQADLAVTHAQAEVAEAEATLAAAGALADDQGGYYLIKAPRSGTLVSRVAVLGAYATDETSLGRVVDTGRMWVLCDLPEEAVGDVQLGASLRFHGDDGREAQGAVTWVAAAVDPTTRLVAVRAEVDNRDGRLRAHQYGRASLAKAQGGETWLVPRAAVQRLEQRSIVFVREKQGVYQPRVVTLHGTGNPVAVTGHLREGDQVVTQGAVLLKTELLPGAIGAGCCEVSPPVAAAGGK